MKDNKRFRLKAGDLTAASPSSWLPFRTTRELNSNDGVIGQERALRAVETGLKIPTRGYNIFAVGDAGSGKTSTLERLLRDRAASEPVSPDICYVYNFKSPDRPIPLLLPPGEGRALCRDMDRIVGELERMIPRILSEGAFGHIRAGIIAETRSQAEELTDATALVAGQLGLLLEETDQVLKVSPMYRGKPITEEQMQKLPPRSRHRLENKIIEFQKQVDSFTYARRQLEIDHENRLLAAETRAVTPLIEELFDSLLSRYRMHGPGVSEYLALVKDHCLSHHQLFVGQDDSPDDNNSDMAQMLNLNGQDHSDDPKVLFHVNVLIDRSEETGAPVVMERLPAASNLLGLFEYRETAGGLITDHTMIRSGSLHQANGGYLLIQATDLLTHDNAWNCLKRALRHKEIRIEEGMGQSERPKLAGALKPGTVPLDVKVILVGGHDVYYHLKLEDENFQRLFKILADFEPSMPRTRENVLKLAGFAGKVCEEEGYLPMHKSGIIRIVEFASRKADHKERLITRRAQILDLLAESNMFAMAAGARSIRKQDVETALYEQHHRHGSVSSAVSREIDAGSIMIKTRGGVVGQINGIALYDVAGFVFGTPVRITARTYAGRRGVVNIDREVNLSGAVHDKGALILIGYLGGRYAQTEPLGFSASITFEQSYDEIDGDSASSAELYSLLSSLAERPIYQGIAVTGSVNQLGELQPIGGVNDKIEGVFDVCKRRGLTGNEGVMIPTSNVRNLMLKEEVIEAVRQGLFHVYAVSTIDEGIEVLTGIPAGKRLKNGDWEKDSINYLVQRRLFQLVKAICNKPSTSYDTEL